MKRLPSFAAVSLFLLLAFFSSAQGEEMGFSPSMTAAEGRPGDVAELNLPYDGSMGEVGAFLVRVEFDPSVFECAKARVSPALRNACAETLDEKGRVSSIYAGKGQTVCLNASEETFTYWLRVRDDAAPGKTEIKVSLCGLVDPASCSLESDTDFSLSYTVLPPTSGQASLMSLASGAGELTPAFSPDCFEYGMTVPFSVSAVTFSAEASQGATVKVNRKNLGVGGSDTLFLITVTAEDRKTKEEYRVTVHREEKPAPSPTAEPSKAPSKTPKPSPVPEAGAKTESPQPTASSPPTAPPSSSPSPPLQTQETAPSPAPARRETTRETGPSLTIRSGSNSYAPLILAALFLGAATALSGPLSRWLAERFPGKPDRKDPPEDDDDEK